MIGPLDALPVREQFAVQPQRFAASPASPVQWAMPWRSPQRVGVVGPEDALPVREQLAA